VFYRVYQATVAVAKAFNYLPISLVMYYDFHIYLHFIALATDRLPISPESFGSMEWVSFLVAANNGLCSQLYQNFFLTLSVMKRLSW
jgi:hypothetical protein